MKFEEMFFRRRNGHAFFQANNGSRDTRPLDEWLASFAGDEHETLQNLVSQKEIHSSLHTIGMQAQRTTYGAVEITEYISNSVGFNIPYTRPSSVALSGIANLYQINPNDMAAVNQRYERMVKELIEFILNDPYMSRKALNEFHTFYDPAIVAEALGIRNSLKYTPGFETFDSDLHNYEQTMTQLLTVYLPVNNQNDKMQSSLLNLYVLLIYQAMHPGTFEETFKEKFTRYLSIICTYTFQALIFLSLALLILAPFTTSFVTLMAMTSAFTPEILLIFALSTAFLVAEIYGVNLLLTYIENNSEDKTLSGYVGNHLSNFFISTFELIFDCKTFEFEMTRVLEKGKSFLLKEQAEDFQPTAPEFEDQMPPSPRM